VVRSTQTRDLANTATGPGDAGQVTVANELPGATQNSAAGGTSEEGSTTEETTNYEISKTTATEMTEAGGIKRLSIAVVVDGIYTTDATGNSTYARAPRPRSTSSPPSSNPPSALMKRVATRCRFPTCRSPTVRTQHPGTSEPGLFDFTRDDLINGRDGGDVADRAGAGPSSCAR
jgi:flagellar M-ring protein FliF